MFAWKSKDWSQSATIGGMMPHLGDDSTGMLAGTKVATQSGWRPVEAICEGDLVLTFDGGLQPVKKVIRTQLFAAAAETADWPLFVPAGALGNREDMHVLPQQLILVESDTAEEVLGDPFALIPAAALDGFRGITRMRPGEVVETVELQFDSEEIAFANIGALFLCRGAGDLLDMATSDYAPLSMKQADFLVDCLAEEDMGYVPVKEAAQAFRMVA